MEVKINKDIREYSENAFWGLTMWQFSFFILGCIAAVGCYFLFRDHVGLEILSWICIFAAFPFIALGFIRYNGMTAEKILWAWIKSQILMPKVLLFIPENMYYQMICKKERKRGRRK